MLSSQKHQLISAAIRSLTRKVIAGNCSISELEAGMFNQHQSEPDRCFQVIKLEMSRLGDVDFQEVLLIHKYTSLLVLYLPLYLISCSM